MFGSSGPGMYSAVLACCVTLVDESSCQARPFGVLPSCLRLQGETVYLKVPSPRPPVKPMPGLVVLEA